MVGGLHDLPCSSPPVDVASPSQGFVAYVEAISPRTFRHLCRVGGGRGCRRRSPQSTPSKPIVAAASNFSGSVPLNDTVTMDFGNAGDGARTGSVMVASFAPALTSQGAAPFAVDYLDS